MLVIIILAIGVIGMAGMLIWYSMLKKTYAKNEMLYAQDKLQIKNKTNVGEIADKFYQSLYNKFILIPVIKYYTKKTRLKLEMTNDFTEYEIRRQTSKNIFFALVFMFIALGVLLNLVNDLYMSLIIIIGVLIITEKMIDLRVTSVSDRILRQMPEAFTNIRHAFHEHGMIEESFNAAIDELGDKDIVPQLKRIKEAMLAEKPDIELERYYDTAPNRFLKLFAGISYLTMELGDRKVDGTSVYLKNLNNILSDVYLEVLKIDTLNYKFRSLTIIAVAPLLFVKPLQSWAESNFPALVNFYNSSIGFIIQSLILISIFISYIFLRILKEDSEQIKFDRVVTTKWQDKLYRNEYVRLIVDAFKPKAHTAKLRKTEKLIKNNNAYLTVEWLYINKLATAVGVTLAMVVLLLNINLININAIYNRLSDEFVAFGKLTPQQEQAAKALNDRDRTYVEKYKNEKISKDQLASELKTQNKGQLDQKEVDRVWDKINQVRNAYYKYWYLLIALAFGYVGYVFPTFVLIIKNKIREMEKENEIMQFQSIILMLMYIERIDVQTILEWLSRFSYAFKEPISTSLNNYESGAYESLEELKDAVPYKDFERIVEQLQSAVERIPIRSAFDELETERSYYHDRRKTGNEQLISKKVMIGKALGFTPMVILVGGYLVAPLIIVSIMQMMTYFGQIMV